MNILYVVPDLKKVSGGPRTRVSLFKQVFLKNGGVIIEKKNKISKSIVPKKINLVYVESATNRIGISDLISLFFLRFYSKKIIVFIRDIYIELFPEEYSSFRNKITCCFNKISNYYLTLISSSMVFPTVEMGNVYFDKNWYFPRRPYTDLPPGTVMESDKRHPPDFTKKIGILYLGGTFYPNSGFKTFLAFAKKYEETYNFFTLSGDSGLDIILSNSSIHLQKLDRKEIPGFIYENNIAYALHTRPRNIYDDLTFPIKVLDFISLQLPFLSERHLPLVNLLGNDYELFISIDNITQIHHKIQNTSENQYQAYIDMLYQVSLENSYDNRYKKLLDQ